MGMVTCGKFCKRGLFTLKRVGNSMREVFFSKINNSFSETRSVPQISLDVDFGKSGALWKQAIGSSWMWIPVKTCSSDAGYRFSDLGCVDFSVSRVKNLTLVFLLKITMKTFVTCNVDLFTMSRTRRFVEFWSLDMNSYLEPWILKFVLLKFFEHGNLVVVLSIIVKIL
ncbi:hypothetical protein RclHR1_01010005 [Rhizophagus clarus]|uniref:Uncharacterized protein n=1 Tax=Rhizophagus clarus TaxID=94130 RepID=A0A2Z6QET4_9GLOM|nr:hypothetical protein RclHR1_01010005 [Rhizophagus clarus]